MKTLKEGKKGITLIALVITIIVLLILAGVSIAMLTGENGILTQAQKAKTETENAAVNEASILDEYNQYLNNEISGEDAIGGLDTVTGTETTNTTVQDSLGNKVVVPAGFKVVNPTANVEDGIVIEDVSYKATAGSQFVWIPVGEVKKEDGLAVNITLGRYSFDRTTGEPSNFGGTYTEDTLSEHTYDNAPAKDITTFISKVDSTGGYYIGRYEARKSNNYVIVNSSNSVYNSVTQLQAANLSQEMYNDSNFESDLTNSYAWDTAIVFIQSCSAQTNYANQTSLNSSLALTGTTNDNPCNIYDMASNCYEWTTETCPLSSGHCVFRGDSYFSSSSYYAAKRDYCDTTIRASNFAFRPILYL